MSIARYEIIMIFNKLNENKHLILDLKREYNVRADLLSNENGLVENKYKVCNFCCKIDRVY